MVIHSTTQEKEEVVGGGGDSFNGLTEQTPHPPTNQPATNQFRHNTSTSYTCIVNTQQTLDSTNIILSSIVMIILICAVC